MNAQDDARFEAQLRRLRPAPLPKGLLGRLQAARPAATPRQRSLPRLACGAWSARFWRRWLAPAAAGVILAVILARGFKGGGGPGGRVGSTDSPGRALEATEVVIDRQLVETFDAVATLPGGEPVRLRCREWLEAFILRNPAGGWEVEQRRPRLEIVPVAVETY